MNSFYSKRWLLLCVAIAGTALSLTQAGSCSPEAESVPARSVSASSGTTSSAVTAEADKANKSVREQYKSIMQVDQKKLERLRKEASIPEDAAPLTLFQAEEYALKYSPTLQSSKYAAMVSHEHLSFYFFFGWFYS